MDGDLPWWANYLPFAVLAGVMLWRWRRLERARPLRPRLLLLAPVFYGILVIVVLMAMLPSMLGWLCFAAGLAIGALAGWQRARLMRLHLDPDNGRVMVRQSPAALILLVALAVGRRLMLPHNVTVSDDGSVPANLLYVTDGLFGFALGLIAAQSVELWHRARVLTAAARVSATRP